MRVLANEKNQSYTFFLQSNFRIVLWLLLLVPPSTHTQILMSRYYMPFEKR